MMLMLVIIPKNTLILDTESGRYGRLNRDITVNVCSIPDDPAIAVFIMLGREYTVYVSQCRIYHHNKVA